MVKRTQVRLNRHLDSQRLSNGEKKDGPSSWGLRTQAPRIAGAIQDYFDGQTPSNLNAFASPLYRTTAGALAVMELLGVYQEGRDGAPVRGAKPTVLSALDGMPRSSAYKARMAASPGFKAAKKADAAGEPGARDELERLIIGFCLNPDNLQGDADTESPYALGERYFSTIGDAARRLVGQEDGYEGLDLLFAHEPGCTATAVYALGLDRYDHETLGGPLKSGEALLFNMEAAPGSDIVIVEFDYDQSATDLEFRTQRPTFGFAIDTATEGNCRILRQD
jgi:hypothetical protein